MCVGGHMCVHRQIGLPSLYYLNYDSTWPRATALPERAKSTQIGLSETSGCGAGPPGIQNEAAVSFPRPASPTKIDQHRQAETRLMLRKNFTRIFMELVSSPSPPDLQDAISPVRSCRLRGEPSNRTDRTKGDGLEASA
ncbi:hypothetical protein CRENBAI_005595 [Crenichthys baileyi]|uniref:Uncharacterized protein n=1 Tax=Crenichthys baileyi TaxID=28760 RepID=A0AAV9S9D8_9TELE